MLAYWSPHQFFFLFDDENRSFSDHCGRYISKVHNYYNNYCIWYRKIRRRWVLDSQVGYLVISSSPSCVQMILHCIPGNKRRTHKKVELLHPLCVHWSKKTYSNYLTNQDKIVYFINVNINFTASEVWIGHNTKNVNNSSQSSIFVNK